MLSLFSLLFFCFMSVSRSFPVCEKLVGPADQLDPGHFEGSWAFVAGSLSHTASMEALRLRDSITVYFSNSSDSFTYTQINRFGDQCQYLPYNISAEGSTFTFDVENRFSLNASFLYTTCPDCAVMKWVVKSKRRVSVDLYLLSRRRQLSHEEMAEFEAQLSCFQLPPPVIMDPAKELCPEQQEN
uniref:Apolipoprotein M n=1 Tax=Sphaeramia orbicularis TaxID=375764 RepID=A0A673CSH4_9TELE